MCVWFTTNSVQEYVSFFFYFLQSSKKMIQKHKNKPNFFFYLVFQNKDMYSPYHLKLFAMPGNNNINITKFRWLFYLYNPCNWNFFFVLFSFSFECCAQCICSKTISLFKSDHFQFHSIKHKTENYQKINCFRFETKNKSCGLFEFHLKWHEQVLYLNAKWIWRKKPKKFW